jgi:hypothetical protein
MMSKSFHAYNITEFLDDSIGGYLSEIESIVIEMVQTDDHEERVNLMNDIQHIIWQCNGVLK